MSFDTALHAVMLGAMRADHAARMRWGARLCGAIAVQMLVLAAIAWGLGAGPA